MSASHGLRLDPYLVEEAVFREAFRRQEAGGDPRCRDYARRREEILDGERGEDLKDRLNELHGEFFEAFGLLGVLHRALRGTPGLGRAHRILVRTARAAREEGADLRAPASGSGEERTIVIRVRPESFQEPDALVGRLLRELLFVSDMLDGSFGYEPDLPVNLDAPTRNLLRDRYMVLWSLSVDYRLGGQEMAPGARTSARGLLLRVFPGLSTEELDDLLALATGSPRPYHCELMAAASRGLAVGAGVASA